MILSSGRGAEECLGQLDRARAVPMGDMSQGHHEKQHNREWDSGGAEYARQPVPMIRRFGDTTQTGGKRRLQAASGRMRHSIDRSRQRR